MFKFAKLEQKIELIKIQKSSLYFGNICQNRRFSKIKNCRKRLYYYLTYSVIGLKVLLIVLIKKYH